MSYIQFIKYWLPHPNIANNVKLFATLIHLCTDAENPIHLLTLKTPLDIQTQTFHQFHSSMQ